jgi:response regulator of citrate/malate metabolism
MAQKPVPMEKLKQVFQLQRDGIPIREIVRRVGISRNSVRKYLSLLSDCRVDISVILTPVSVILTPMWKEG